MKKYKKRLKLKKSIQVKLIQFVIINVIYLLAYFSIRDASTSYANYCHNGLVIFTTFITTGLVACLGDYIK